MADHDATDAAEPPVGVGATPAQQRSSDPSHSVWVTANAGTGKTRILVDRVLRLLLAGSNPEGILCLTFTKAAAAEMRARVEARLGAWATEPDESALRNDLANLTGNPPSQGAIENARRLFGRVMDLPDGLAIMTIHAFCQSVLRRFPLEAGIAPNFEVMDDRTSAELLQTARDEAMASARVGGKEVSEALAILAVAVTEQTITGALAEVVAQRGKIAELRARYGNVDKIGDALCDQLDVSYHLDRERLTADFCANGMFDVEGLVRAANAAISAGSVTDQAIGQEVLAWLNAAPGDRTLLLERYLALFLTKKNAAKVKFLSKGLLDKHDAFVDALRREQARAVRFSQTRSQITTVRRTLALLRFSIAVIDNYEAEKRRRAALDFDDLIEVTRRLLAQAGAPQWVLFKLDARIDHVLVDEAQDTSPDQWEIVERLVAEFHVGAGARDVDRTLFVVGDDKQSIYSFRGADLQTFRTLRERIITAFEAARQPIRRELLDVSFRSTGIILDMVDRVFAPAEARRGVVTEGENVRHIASRRNEPGLVEVWPLVEARSRTAPSWPLPTDRRNPEEPERDLAEAITGEIRRWLDQGRWLPSAGRPIQPGDILILLVRRGRLQEFLVRAFKRDSVPVAGADRLDLLDHIAVQDLMALGQAVLLPEDDLTFAALLKSPLFGLSEDELFETAWNREKATIWSRLRDLAKIRPEPYARVVRQFEAWQHQADFMPPFEFYANVLGTDGQRQRLVERLGTDALEPIEAFLAQALIYEDGHPASLQGFLHWLQLESQTLKRDTDAGHDQVRIMTVHGAKGLEAPIVFLADAAAEAPAQAPRMIWHEPSALPLWRSPKEDRGETEEEAIAALQTRQEEERQRLLYVAMTRARDELYICGCKTRRPTKTAATSWYDHIANAIDAHDLLHAQEREWKAGVAGSFRRVERQGMASTGDRERLRPPHTTRTPKLPPWVRLPVASERKRPALRLTPSDIGPAEPMPAQPVGDDARQLGITIHRLLEQLPDIDAGRRADAITRYLAKRHSELTPATVQTLIANLQEILQGPTTASLFRKGSLAEQPIAGRIGDVAINGQIDRLVIESDQITFVDYKTNSRPPPDLASIPSQYLSQIALYSLLLSKIYPEKDLRAGILWTSIPRIDFLDQAELKHYIPRTLKSG